MVNNTNKPPTAPLPEDIYVSYIEIAKTVLFQPFLLPDLWKKIKYEKGFKKPFVYHLLMIFTGWIIFTVAEIFYGGFAIILKLSYLLDFFKNYITYFGGGFLFVAVIHLFIKILGGKKNFLETYKVFAYVLTFSPIIYFLLSLLVLFGYTVQITGEVGLFALVIYFILTILGVYMIILESIGVGIIQEISSLRAFFALIFSLILVGGLLPLLIEQILILRMVKAEDLIGKSCEEQISICDNRFGAIKDSCFFLASTLNLAIEGECKENDIVNLCSYIKDSETKGGCYMFTATVLNNSAICDKLDEKRDNIICKAIVNDDMELCNQLDTKFQRDICITGNAQINRYSTELKEEGIDYSKFYLKPEDINYSISELKEEEKETKEPEAGGLLQYASTQDLHNFENAILNYSSEDNKNASFCNQIEDKELRDTCYYSIMALLQGQVETSKSVCWNLQKDSKTIRDTTILCSAIQDKDEWSCGNFFEETYDFCIKVINKLK